MGQDLPLCSLCQLQIAIWKKEKRINHFHQNLVLWLVEKTFHSCLPIIKRFISPCVFMRIVMKSQPFFVERRWNFYWFTIIILTARLYCLKHHERVSPEGFLCVSNHFLFFFKRIMWKSKSTVSVQSPQRKSWNFCNKE